jgi:DNA invertase Pin-like site-specific DNA recombinase
MKQIAIYARVSLKDKQETENQLRQLRDFVAKQTDWEVVHEYIDRASGKRSDREQFQAMLADAARRKFDVLLF